MGQLGTGLLSGAIDGSGGGQDGLVGAISGIVLPSIRNIT
jgi:hypothetical protein